MRRRTFLEKLGASLASATVAPWLAARAAAATTGPGSGRYAGSAAAADFTAWTWVHGNARDAAPEWRARFARFRAAGISGVLVGGGDTTTLADAAHAEGLRFHRWTWIMNRSSDDWVKKNHPEWFDVNRKGESSLDHPPYVPYYQWLCPTRPEVREYLRGVVDEVATHPGVDGVHLDYIRHPDVILPRGLWSKYRLVQDHEMPEYDFCYCEVCRTAFRAQSATDPLQLPDPSADQAWREFRWNSITGVVRELSGAVRGRGKQITAAVFPTPTIARKLVRQAWDQWPLDAVFPMLYHGFYEEDIPWIGRAAREGVRALPATEPLYAGLYLPDLDPSSLGVAIRAARDGGARGVSFFDSNGLTDGHLAVVRDALEG